MNELNKVLDLRLKFGYHPTSSTAPSPFPEASR